jgi:hypothetical protein
MGRKPFDGSHRDAEFLPDAEGLVERRHSPAAGLLILVVAGVFGGLVAWAGLTEVEQVVRAEGQVEPADRVKVVNHPDGGRITTLFGSKSTKFSPKVQSARPHRLASN